jgi:glycosyltransferase involved in cell wall biosynthesis
MNNPFLSIIVPVYNVEKYLHQCVNSILAQTFSDYELIIVDDGSTDSSGDICDEYLKIDKRVKVIHKKNGGHTSARKAGLAISRGEYIGFVDSDDWIEPEMYEKLCGAVQEFHADIVVCGIIYDFNSKTRLAQQNYASGLYSKQNLIETVYPSMIHGESFCGVGLLPALYNKIFKRKILENNIKKVDDRINMGEDMALCYPAMLEASVIYFMSNYLYHYRQSSTQMTRKYKNDYFHRSLLLCSILLEAGIERQFDLKPQIEKRICCFAVRALENEFVDGCPNTNKRKMELITEVCNNPQVIDASKKIKILKIMPIKNFVLFILIKFRWRILIFFLLFLRQLIKGI